MPSISSGRSHTVLAELFLLGGFICSSLALFGVPITNALLLAVALLLQSILGLAILDRLVTTSYPSGLLLLGPGLILGGAVSFTAFQVGGRGWLGLVLMTLVGCGGAWDLFRRNRWIHFASLPIPVFALLGGLTFTALSWEFRELIPAAALLLLLGLVEERMNSSPIWLRISIGVVVIFGLAALALARTENWWLVSDDYLFFEVIAQHITTDGPLADYGVISFTRYHWLTYGWSGVLNLLSGTPEPLVTLGQAIPVIYSLSLASSLLLIRQIVNGKSRRWVSDSVPVWLLVAVTTLDWSGPSTAGVYSVISGLAACGLLAIQKQVAVIRRLAVYAIWLGIVGLTKLPGLVAAIFFVIYIELVALAKRDGSSLSVVKTLPIGVAAALAVIPLVIVLDLELDAFDFKLTTVNKHLGQLAEFGPSFTVQILALHRVWLLILVLLVTFTVASDHKLKALFVGLSPAMILAIVLDTFLSGVGANAHAYFSGPIYFIVALVVVVVPSLNESSDFSDTPRRVLIANVLFLWSIGSLWTLRDWSSGFWAWLGGHILHLDPILVSQIQFFASSPYVALSILALLPFSVPCLLQLQFRRLILQSVVVAMLIVTLTNSLGAVRQEFKTDRKSIADSILGTPAAREVGNWLRRNTNESDLVATNHLYSLDGSPLSDFSLGAWSSREFLVLGPAWTVRTDDQHAAVTLCMKFGSKPSVELASQLRARGVGWFVLDLTLPLERALPTGVVEHFRNQQFIIVKL